MEVWFGTVAVAAWGTLLQFRVGIYWFRGFRSLVLNVRPFWVPIGVLLVGFLSIVGWVSDWA